VSINLIALQFLTHSGSKLREGFGKAQGPLELLSVSMRPPHVVVPILPAAGCIDTDCLNVPVGPRADPHLRPCRWYCKPLDPRPRLFVHDRGPICPAVVEALAASPPVDAWRCKVGSSKPRHRYVCFPQSATLCIDRLPSQLLGDPGPKALSLDAPWV
jgi:hypothetical protein